MISIDKKILCLVRKLNTKKNTYKQNTIYTIITHRARFKIVVSFLGHWGVNLRYPNMVSNMFFWVENHAKGHFRTYEYKKHQLW